MPFHLLNSSVKAMPPNQPGESRLSVSLFIHSFIHSQMDSWKKNVAPFIPLFLLNHASTVRLYERYLERVKNNAYKKSCEWIMKQIQ